VDYEGKNVTFKLDILDTSMRSKGRSPQDPKASNRFSITKFSKTQQPMHHLVLMPAKRKLSSAYHDGAERGTTLLGTLQPRLAVAPLSSAA
jgi:hypothetical protein